MSGISRIPQDKKYPTLPWEQVKELIMPPEDVQVTLGLERRPNMNWFEGKSPRRPVYS